MESQIWQGLDGFQIYLCPCALDKSSFSIGRVYVSAITYIQKIVQCYFRFNLQSWYVPFCYRAAAILGYLPQELLGTSVYEYYHQDDVTHMAEAHKKGKLNTMSSRKMGILGHNQNTGESQGNFIGKNETLFHFPYSGWQKNDDDKKNWRLKKKLTTNKKKLTTNEFKSQSTN